MDLPDSFYTIGWVIWVGWFVILEGASLIDKDPGDTFTEHLRRWGNLRGMDRWVKIRRAALALGIVWLLGHFW
jgi:hypothetical protein